MFCKHCKAAWPDNAHCCPICGSRARMDSRDDDHATVIEPDDDTPIELPPIDWITVDRRDHDRGGAAT